MVDEPGNWGNMSSKLVYISNTAIPSTKANTYQSFCVCEAFSKMSLQVEFWHPARIGDYACDTDCSDGLLDVFERYDIQRLFTLRRIHSLDLSRLVAPSNRIWFVAAALTFSLRCFWELRKEPESTVVYTRDSTSLSVLFLARKLRLLKLKVFYEAHRFSPREARHTKGLDGLVVVNHCLRELYDRESNRNTLVAHDCIRTETFLVEPAFSAAALLEKHHLPANARFATYIGRFQSRGNDKGIRTIVSCIKHVSDPALVFLFVGGPMDEVPLFRRIMQEQGVREDRAIFLDGQPVSELKHFHRISLLLLMPYPFSTHHAYQLSPLKMFEYMTSRRPIIASDLPSIREVLNEGNAILCRPDAPEDLAAKINWTLQNDCSRLTEAAWHDVQEYTWDRRAEKIVSWMRESGAFPVAEATGATARETAAHCSEEAAPPAPRSLIDRRFKSNLLFNYVTQGIGIAAGFVTVTLITRNAGLNTYGLVSMMAAIGGVLTNLISFRTNEAVISFYKRGEVERDPGNRRLALAAGMLLDLAVGLFLFLLVGRLSPYIAADLLKDPSTAPGVSIYAVTMLSTFLRGTPIGLLIALERFRLVNLLNLAEQFLKMVVIALLAGFGYPLTFRTIIAAFLAPAALITLGVYWLPLAKLAGELRSAVIPRQKIGDYARFSMSTFISSALKAGNQNVDTLVLGYFTNPASVGAYTLFRQFLAPVSMVTSPFAAQSYPQFSEAVAQRRVGLISSTVSHANRLLLGAFLGLALAIVPSLVVYGNWNGLDFRGEHYLTFALMMLNALILQQLWWCRPFSVAVDPNLSLRGNLIYSVSMLISLVLAVKLAGLVGVGLALTATALMQQAYWSASMRKIDVQGTV